MTEGQPVSNKSVVGIAAVVVLCLSAVGISLLLSVRNSAAISNARAERTKSEIAARNANLDSTKNVADLVDAEAIQPRYDKDRPHVLWLNYSVTNRSGKPISYVKGWITIRDASGKVLDSGEDVFYLASDGKGAIANGGTNPVLPDDAESYTLEDTPPVSDLRFEVKVLRAQESLPKF